MADDGAVAAAECAIPLPTTERQLATIALILASAMQAADATIANVALPQLERDLGGGVALGAWVVTSYLCATAVVAPLTGWLRRRCGARRLFAGGVAGFVAASLLCALAPSGGALILFRVLQGATGGILHPLAQAILLDLYPRQRHGRMLAIWGAAVMVGPIVGPALGGIVTDLASWRWVFALNLPIGAAAIAGIWRVLPRGERAAELGFDLTGVALLAFAVGGVQFCLERGVGHSWLDSPELSATAILAAAAAIAMIDRARKRSFTVVRPAVFADINFATAAFYNFTASALLFVTIVFVPALLQGPLGYGATAAGMCLVPRSIAMILVMLGVGRVVGKTDIRLLLAGGTTLMVIGLAVLSAIQRSDAIAWIIVGSTLQAAGGGMLFTCLSTVGFSTLPAEMRTDAAGVYSLLRQLGCATGVALMMALLRVQMDARVADLLVSVGLEADQLPARLLYGAQLHAYRACFREMALLMLLLSPGLWLFRATSNAATAKRVA